MSQRTIGAVAARTGAILLAFTVVFTALMAFAYRSTKDIIAASAEEEKMKLVNEVLPPDFYDNALLADAVVLPPTKALGLDEATRVFRARRQEKPVALVLETVAPDGYSGRIRLLVAVRTDGEAPAIAGVRVTQHKETPGLGDYIEPRKDKNKARPWITQFNDISFARLPREAWKVKKDGGRFDQVTGATITARAVTNALARAMAFVGENRERLLALPAGAGF